MVLADDAAEAAVAGEHWDSHTPEAELGDYSGRNTEEEQDSRVGRVGRVGRVAGIGSEVNEEGHEPLDNCIHALATAQLPAETLPEVAAVRIRRKTAHTVAAYTELASMAVGHTDVSPARKVQAWAAAERVGAVRMGADVLHSLVELDTASPQAHEILDACWDANHVSARRIP